MSASGDYVPPMFIFGRARMKYELTKNGPVNAVYKTSKNGWINEDLFFEWIQLFAKHTKCSVDDKVLLVIDNHSSHCTLQVYNFCRENGITIVTLPPHTSHRLQPLDVCFYGPLKTAYNNECDYFLKSKNYQKINQTDIAELFKKAFNKTATLEKAQKGFEATGIFPLNRDVVNEEEFIIIEENEEINKEEPKRSDETKKKRNKPADKNKGTIDNITNVTEYKRKVIVNISDKDLTEAGPSSLTKQKTTEQKMTNLDSDSESDNSIVYCTDEDSDNDHDKSVIANVSFEDLQPLPRFLRSCPKGRKKTHSQLFTTTPNKEELEAKENIKKRKIALGKSNVKRNVMVIDKPKKVKCNKSKKLREEATEVCIVCEEFGKDNEWWVTCSCGQSAHAECGGVKVSEVYVCHFCQP